MSTMKVCPYCGTSIPADNNFCGSCGRQVTGAPVAPAAPPPTAPAPAPPPAWQQPAPAYYAQPQYANNSGTGVGPVPPEVRGWNWGAFFWSWIWGVANGVWVSLLICLLGIIGSIWLGAKGSEMAWAKRRFDSVEQFKSTQRAWATWGWVLFALNFIVVVIIALVFGAAIMAGIASGELDPSTFDF